MWGTVMGLVMPYHFGNNKKSLFFFLFLAVTLSENVFAEVLGLAGFNGSEESLYGYIGVIIPINTTLAEEGFRVRLWGNYQDYEYDGNIGGTPTSFDADGFGGSASLGYRWNFASTHVSAYAGVAFRDIDIEPEDPSSDTEDDDVGARFALELNHKLTSNVDASLIGNYTAVFDDYWVRLRPGYTFANGLKFGPEVIVQGDDDFDKQNYGAFLDGMKLGNIKVGIHGGYEDADDDSAYAGISLSTVF